ncbi:MAG TPA: hypothetical protein VD948_08920, partial [Rhodothermales bacterium]|nr:hypothetical protein [Rhodothermales bacterium]
GITRPTLLGHLFLLWWWALDYAPDGDVTRYGADELALAAEWDEYWTEWERQAGKRRPHEVDELRPALGPME